jgi:hypothetical protein
VVILELRDAILRKLAAVWRVLGSPRIPGDEKAVASLKSTWSRRRELTRRKTSLTTRTRNMIIGAGGILGAIVLIWLIISLFGGGDEETAVVEGIPTPTPFAGPEFMTEVQALSLAIAGARDAGLVSENFKHVARRIQFGEYAQAIGELSRAERGLLETPSETEIWAIAFAGDVELELDTGERVEYDNLTVVLDALTGKIYRVEAFYGEYESEARAPVWLRPPTPTPVPTPAR